MFTLSLSIFIFFRECYVSSPRVAESKIQYKIDSSMCNEQCGEGVCGSWGKGSHLGSWRARSARRGKRWAISLRQWRRIDVAECMKTQEMAPRDIYAQSECYCALWNNCYTYNHNRNRGLLYVSGKKNHLVVKHHLHSSSDVREVVSSTVCT